jgi:hypothetical protein
MMYAGAIVSLTEMYFVGYTDKIYDSAYSQTFSQYTSFIMSSVSTNSFLTLSYTTSSLALTTSVPYTFTYYNNVVFT